MDTHAQVPLDAAPGTPPRLRVGLIGAGRAGAVIARVLERVGHPCVATTAISAGSRERAARLLPSATITDPAAVCAAADLIIVATPDDVIEDVVRGLVAVGAITSRHIVAHLSGRLGCDVLEPARAAGALVFAFHPAMTLTGASEDVFRLEGCPFGITADAAALPVAQALAYEINAVPVVIAAADRVLYHAALAHASNHLVTLLAQSMDIARAAGIDNPGDYLRAIVEATVNNALRSGDAALTGPIARGDLGTVGAHLDALTRRLPHDVVDAYRALAVATMSRRGPQYTQSDLDAIGAAE